MSRLVRCDRCGTTNPDSRHVKMPQDWAPLVLDAPFAQGIALDLCGQCWRAVKRFATEAPPTAAP